MLGEDSCWGILANLEVGRLATVHDGQPQIYPVNFVVDGPSIVFRTAEGSKLDELAQHAEVAFEADDWDLDRGRSVVIKGTASKITEEAELARARKLPLRPWVPTVKNNFVRICPTEVNGRVFHFGPAN